MVPHPSAATTNGAAVAPLTYGSPPALRSRGEVTRRISPWSSANHCRVVREIQLSVTATVWSAPLSVCDDGTSGRKHLPRYFGAEPRNCGTPSRHGV